MTIILSILLFLAIGLLGWIVLPLLGMVIILPVQIVISFINKLLGYMLARYISLVVDAAVLAFLIWWAGERFSLITWPAWLLAGWCMFTAGNALVLFDIQCYLNGTGAWADRREIDVIEGQV